MAAAEIAARAEIKTCFKLLRNRWDTNDPATQAWREAIARWHLAFARVYPEDFWCSIAALKQARTRDAATGAWVWSRAPADAVETAICFLEADLPSFRSGYLKERLIRHLVRQPLGLDESHRLKVVALKVLDARDCREFRAFCRLAARVVDADFLDAMAQRLSSDDTALARRAGWMRDAILRARRDLGARQRPEKSP